MGNFKQSQDVISMNCSVRLKTIEMDLALLLAAGVATRHYQQQPPHVQQQQHSQQQQHHQQQHQHNQQQSLSNNNNSTAANSSSHTTTQSLGGAGNISHHLNQYTDHTVSQSQFQNNVGLVTTDIRDSSSPTQQMGMSNAAVAAAADLSQYLRASSVSLQSQVTLGGGGGNGSSGSGGSGSGGGGIMHISQPRQHVPFTDPNSNQSTTPRAVDNQYSFV